MVLEKSPAWENASAWYVPELGMEDAPPGDVSRTRENHFRAFALGANESLVQKTRTGWQRQQALEIFVAIHRRDPPMLLRRPTVTLEWAERLRQLRAAQTRFRVLGIHRQPIAEHAQKYVVVCLRRLLESGELRVNKVKDNSLPAHASLDEYRARDDERVCLHLGIGEAKDGHLQVRPQELDECARAVTLAEGATAGRKGDEKRSRRGRSRSRP